MLSQQLANPMFDDPKDLVSWMGAVQAQERVMSKWAIGLRMKNPSLQKVEKALETGELVRTHVLRPTWHITAAEDIRWMLQLSEKNVKQAILNWGKSVGIDEQMSKKFNKEIVKILKDGNHLTKPEIEDEVVRQGFITNKRPVNTLLSLAEVAGLICNGVERDKKHTYALMDERIPAGKDYHKDEALATLAQKYFRSHSPASLQDFVWWSGLTTKDAKNAIKLVENELIYNKFTDPNLILHEMWLERLPHTDIIFHLLPPFDEYLISYKDRCHVLLIEDYPKAFNNYGTFYPVVLCGGDILGNWEKISKNGQISFKISYFDELIIVPTKIIKNAEERYRNFIL